MSDPSTRSAQGVGHDLVSQPLLAHRARPRRVPRADARRAGRAVHLHDRSHRRLDAGDVAAAARGARRIGPERRARTRIPRIDSTSTCRISTRNVLQPFIVADARRPRGRPITHAGIPDDVRQALRREMCARRAVRRAAASSCHGGRTRRTIVRDRRRAATVPARRVRGRVRRRRAGRPRRRACSAVRRSGTVVRELAPTMALVGGSVLVVGSTLIALFVFGPARQAAEAAAGSDRRFGAGDLTRARAGPRRRRGGGRSRGRSTRWATSWQAARRRSKRRTRRGGSCSPTSRTS